MIVRSILIVVLGMCAAVSAQAATVYKWTDEHGVTHYGFDAPKNEALVEKSLQIKDELRDKKDVKRPIIVYKNKKYIKSFSELKQSQRDNDNSSVLSNRLSVSTSKSSEFAMCERVCSPEPTLTQLFPLGDN